MWEGASTYMPGWAGRHPRLALQRNRPSFWASLGTWFGGLGCSGISETSVHVARAAKKEVPLISMRATIKAPQVPKS